MIFYDRPKDFSPRFEVVNCLFEYDGKILLLHRHAHKLEGNKWGVPGGKVDPGESPLDAMRRELKEETGYEANEAELIFSRTLFVRYPDYDFVYHMYSLTLRQSHDVVLEVEAHKDFVWVKPYEALVFDLVGDMEPCIKLHYYI